MHLNLSATPATIDHRRVRSELPCRGEAGWRSKYIQLRDDIESILTLLQLNPFGEYRIVRVSMNLLRDRLILRNKPAQLTASGFLLGGVMITPEKAGSFIYFYMYLIYYVWSGEGMLPGESQHLNETADPS